MAEKRKPTDRMLDIFSAVVRSGPISLNDIAKVCEMPRSSAHRALVVLQNQGMIRARLSDHKYVVAHQFAASLKAANVSHRAAEILSPILQEIANSSPVHLELGVFRGIGQFDTIDTTEQRLELETHHSLVYSPAALMAQTVLPPEVLIRHLDKFLTLASRSEHAAITTGQHRKSLANLRRRGFSAIRPYLCFPFLTHQRTGGCVLIRNRPTIKSASCILADQTNEVLTLLRTSTFSFQRM